MLASQPPMSDSRPSKRRRCNTSGSIGLEGGSSGDCFLRSEGTLAPLRSEDVLLGGLDALTSADIVKDILLRELAAGDRLKNFETEARHLVATHPSLFLGNHPSSFKGDAREASTSPLPVNPRTDDYQEYSMPLQSLGSKPTPSLTETRMSSGDWVADFVTDLLKEKSADLGPLDPSLIAATYRNAIMEEQPSTACPPPLSAPLASHFTYHPSSSAPAPSAASAPSPESARMSSGDWIAKFITDLNDESTDLGPLDPSLLAATYRDVMAGQSNASPPPLSAPLAGHLECHGRSSAPAPPATSADKTNTPLSAPATTRKKKNRKRMLDETTVAEPNEGDVLSGRGGYTNIHPGNVRFRRKALELRPRYERSSKEEKQAIADVLVDFVRDGGNRFLGRGKDGLWHEMIGNGPHKKASQALRERIRGRNDD